MQLEITPTPLTDRQVNLTGRRVGAWTVIGFAGTRRYSRGQLAYYWTCRCDCGVEAPVAAGSLRDGISNGCQACGHKRSGALKRSVRLVDHSGERHNSWTIVSDYGTKNYGLTAHCRKQLYNVRCDCGTEVVRALQSIVSGQSRSCRRCRDYPPDMKAKLGLPRKSAVAETRTTTAEG